MLAAEEGGIRAHRHDEAVVLLGLGLDIAQFNHPRIVHEDIEPPVPRDDIVDEHLPLRIVTHIVVMELGHFAQFSRDPHAVFAVHIGENNARALAHKHARISLTEALGRPGNDRDLAGQSSAQLGHFGVPLIIAKFPPNRPRC